MPIYEYECEACGHTLDALQKMSDALLKECPACGKPALRKRMSAPRFRLKGAGWYETDFKQGNRRNIAEGGEGGEKKSADDGGDKKSTESKSSGESASSASAAPKESSKEPKKKPAKEKSSGGDSGSTGSGKSTTSSSDA